VKNSTIDVLAHFVGNFILDLNFRTCEKRSASFTVVGAMAAVGDRKPRIEAKNHAIDASR
jgi:hypothetical protein